MENSKKQYQRRSEAEWQKIVSRYQSSGLSQAKFCKRECIAPSTLQKWRKRLSGSESFISLPAIIPQSSHYQLEVELPSGAVIRIK